MNPMMSIRIAKVTLNMGFKDEKNIERATKLLATLTTGKVVITKTRKRSTFGPAKGRPIGVMVTVRGKEAAQLLNRLLDSRERKVKEASFDATGNFSFGIEECINIPGMKYDPDIGIMGMDVCVTLERPGYRVSRRRLKPAKIGKGHRITKADAVEFATKDLSISIQRGGKK